MLNKPALTLLLLIPLGILVIVKGILPAFSGIRTDFPNYYTAGCIARTGGNIDRLYDDQWFQQEIYAHGMQQQGKFSPFPPPTALLFIPLSFLEPLTALRVVTAVNIVLLLMCMALVARIFKRSIPEAAVFTLLSGTGLINCFLFGQLYLALSMTMLLSYYLLITKRPSSAGLCLSVLIPVKYFPVVMVPYFAIQKEWKALLMTIAGTMVIFGLSVLLLGWKIHEDWLFSVLGRHLQSDLSEQNPFSPSFQTFDSLLRRLFVFDPRWNPSPAINGPVFYITGKVFVLVSAISAAAYAIARLMKTGTANDLAITILCLLGLVIAPATATYHFLLLWLPAGILLSHLWSDGRKGLATAVFLSYAAIGFLPYSFFVHFDARGWLTFLAYPRLALVIMLFVISILATDRIAKQT